MITCKGFLHIYLLNCFSFLCSDHTKIDTLCGFDPTGLFLGWSKSFRSAPLCMDSSVVSIFTIICSIRNQQCFD